MTENSHPPHTKAAPQATERRNAALWRRRLFEAEAGLTRYVVDSRAGAHMHELLQVKQAIFAGLQEADGQTDWKAAFFRAQALMEQFIVRHFGHDELATWAATNSSVYAAVDENPKRDAAVPLRRLSAQADLYGSDITWGAEDEDHAALTITHCAIWDYREQARTRGVTITLQSPCEYCVPATTAMITHKGLNAHHQLTQDDNGSGCTWTASRHRHETTAPRGGGQP